VPILKWSSILLFSLTLFAIAHLCLPHVSVAAIDTPALRQTIEKLSSFNSRATGSQGYQQTADYITKSLKSLELEPQEYFYEVPIRRFLGATLTIAERQYPLSPFAGNAITPEATDDTISGPLYYVGHGNLEDLDDIDLRGAVILMDFDSGRNWQLLASLGASAVIFIQDEASKGRMFFTEKQELTPLRFPCFWMQHEEANSDFWPFDCREKSNN